ncbi:MAG: hypothetical protein JRJ84_21000 [Deltaproteobacteria bacterium]|nr:hypothetical protein [Deltaproteobacteria bacterium]
MTELDQLFAAVYATPDDDGPRWALAEALSAAEDPRGELIRLQLEQSQAGKASRESRARQKALFKAHGPGWLAPLEGVVVKRSVRWERGFPVSGNFAFPRSMKGWEDIIGCSALATLRTLDLEKGNVIMRLETMERLLFESPLRHLRSLGGVSPRLLPRLLHTSPPWSLERVTCPGGGGGADKAQQQSINEELGQAFASGSGLPKLVDLTLSDYWFGQDPGSRRWLWETDAGRRLESLRMCEQVEGFVPWHARLTDLGDAIGLTALELFTGSSLVLERTEDGWTRITGRLDTRSKWVDRERRRLRRVIDQLGIADVAVRGFVAGG